MTIPASFTVSTYIKYQDKAATNQHDQSYFFVRMTHYYNDSIGIALGIGVDPQQYFFYVRTGTN